MSDRTPNVKAVFGKALEIESREAQSAYLDEACGDDTQLRREVEDLLQAIDQAGSFMARPVMEPQATLDHPITEEPGTQIGPYKLLQLLGEGGMGVVYMAEQTEPVKRRVALKIIKPGMDTRQVITRFEAERQALAMMDHPNIAKVLDAGTTEFGRPYFVMALVHGMPVTEFCDEQQLSNHERLRLFIDVCHAVQHAHQKGIIHRDLKPSNVLVTMHDERPVPKVIDFGVSKALCGKLTDKSVYTAYGQMVGTPLYMSPEQARLSGLDVDTRSDVYSLGVLLYELLTGTTPFDKETLQEADFDELRRIIREDDPPRPSDRVSTLRAEEQSTVSQRRRLQPRELSHTLRGDLDWIVMRAMEKDRARRYESVGALAADLARYLADEPVEACPPSPGYRLRKFIRRNRTAVVATLVVTAALLAGGGLAVWQGLRAARAEAVTARQGVDVNRRISETMGELQAAIAKAKSSPAGDTEAWAEAREAAERGRTLAEHELADAKLVQRVAALAGEIDQGQRDRESIARLLDIRLMQTATDAEKSTFRRRLALPEYLRLFSEEGLDPRSVAPEDAAARVRRRSPAVAAALLAALDDWLDILRALQEQEPTAEHVRLREQVAALVDALDTDAWRKRMRAAAEAKDYELLLELAGSHEALEQSPSSLAMLGSALCAEQEHWQTGIALLQRAQREDPGNFWINRTLGMEFLDAKQPEPDEAVRYYAAAVAIRPDTAGAHLNLGNALRHAGKPEQAIAEYERAIALAPNYAGAHNSLGALLGDDLQRWPEAEAAFRRAIDLDPNSSSAYYNLGNALSKQSQSAEAVAAYRQAIALDPNYALAHNNLAAELRRQGKHEEALEELRRAVDLEPENPMFRINLGDRLRQRQNWADAVGELRRAVELDPENAVAHRCLGQALFGQGEPAEAAAEFREAVRLDPDQARSHECLGEALAADGKLDEAITRYREAIRIDPDVTGGYVNLGIALEKQGKRDDALDVYREEIARHPEDPLGHYNLGVCLARLDRQQEALAALREAVRREPGFFDAHYNLSILLGKMGDPQGAMEACHEAIRLKPDDPRPHYNLGNMLLDAGQVEAARAEFREVIRLDPQHTDAYVCMGAALYRLGRFPEVIGAYRKAMQFKPEYEANCRVSIGQALLRLEKWGEAAAEFRQAIGIQPSLAEAHDGLAWSLFRQGQPEEALDACREAIRLDPAVGRYHANLGKVLWELGRKEEAVAAFRRAVELAPNEADYHSDLGHSLLLMGEDLDEAVRELKHTIRLKPDDADAFVNLGSAHSRQHKDAEEIAAYEAALRIKPDYALAYHNLGQACRRTGDFAKALDAYRNAEKYGAETPGWPFNSGGLVRWVERHLEFEQLAAQKPPDPSILSGRLPPADERQPETQDHHGEVHRVELKPNTAYLIELVTAAFDGVLAVQDADGKVLTTCDDIMPGEDANARLFLPQQQVGACRVVVHGKNPTDAGPFFLRVQPLQKAGQDDVIRRKPKDPSADLTDLHELQLDKPGLYLLDVQADFEVGMCVLTADGRTLMSTETSAKRQRLLLDAAAGKYRAVVSPVKPDAEYTLTVQRYQPASAPGGAERKTKTAEKR